MPIACGRCPGGNESVLVATIEDSHTYLRDVLERLPTQPVSRIGELLPRH